jgi:hypothetical protein
MKGKVRVVLRVVAVSDAKVLVRLVDHFHGAITCLALYGVSLTEAGVLAISVQTFAGCLEKLRQGSTKTRIGLEQFDYGGMRNVYGDLGSSPRLLTAAHRVA